METFLNEEYLSTEDIITIGNATEDLDLRVLCATVLVLRSTGAKCIIMSRQKPLWDSRAVWSQPGVTRECSVYDRIRHGLTDRLGDWRTDITIYQEASPNVVSINKEKAEEILSSLLETPPVNPLVVELSNILGPHDLLNKQPATAQPYGVFDELPVLGIKTIPTSNAWEYFNNQKGKHK